LDTEGHAAPRRTGVPVAPNEIDYSPGMGIFKTLDEAVGAAQKAFEELHRTHLRVRERMIEEMRITLRDNVDLLSEWAVRETGIGRVAGCNAVVFNPHPYAKGCCAKTINLMNEASIRAGGPGNVVTMVAEPTLDTATALMKHKGIRLLVVTGGPGVVQAAMASGK